MRIVLTKRLLFHGFPMTKNNGRLLYQAAISRSSSCAASRWDFNSSRSWTELDAGFEATWQNMGRWWEEMLDMGTDMGTKMGNICKQIWEHIFGKYGKHLGKIRENLGIVWVTSTITGRNMVKHSYKSNPWCLVNIRLAFKRMLIPSTSGSLIHPQMMCP